MIERARKHLAFQDMLIPKAKREWERHVREVLHEKHPELTDLRRLPDVLLEVLREVCDGLATRD